MAVILGSIVVHAGVGIGMFVSGVWSIERLGGDLRAPSIAIVLPPEPAPSGGGALELPEAKVAVKEKPKKIAQELTQPEPKQVEDATPAVAPTSEIGTGSGEGPGSGSGSAGDKGQCLVDCGPGPSTTPPPKVTAEPRGPEIVPPNVLTMHWLSGTKQIHPSDVTKTQMLREGNHKTLGVVKVCVGETGRVSSVTLARSTKYPAYDALLLSKVRAWTYRPFTAKGRNVKVCGVVTFVYSIK